MRTADRPAWRSRGPCSEQRSDFLGAGDGCLSGEDLLHEHAMHFLVAIGAAVLRDHEAIVVVRGVADGREDDAARRDAGEDERVDVARAENHLEVRSGERSRIVDCMSITRSAVVFGSSVVTGSLQRE